jgi:hypothetical protein
VHAVAEKLISSGFMFSEFDSYGSWVMQHQPSKFAMDYKISYVRNPGTMLAPQTLSKGVVARRLGQSAPQPGVPTFLKNVKCCLNHKRICELGKAMAFDTNGGPRYPVNGTRHHILIWDEHKFRYLGSKDHCVDPLPTELIAAKRQVCPLPIYPIQLACRMCTCHPSAHPQHYSCTLSPSSCSLLHLLTRRTFVCGAGGTRQGGS